MIVVQIIDPADGRVSHEVGPFDDDPDQARARAAAWRLEFLDAYGYDGDFVEIRDVEHRLLDPGSGDDMAELAEFYG